jgi:hypothetical protein
MCGDRGIAEVPRLMRPGPSRFAEREIQPDPGVRIRLEAFAMTKVLFIVSEAASSALKDGTRYATG